VEPERTKDCRTTLRQRRVPCGGRDVDPRLHVLRSVANNLLKVVSRDAAVGPLRRDAIVRGAKKASLFDFNRQTRDIRLER
jgi:hypothetical protein